MVACRECGIESGDNLKDWYSVQWNGMEYFACPKHKEIVYKRFVTEIVDAKYKTYWWDFEFIDPFTIRCSECFFSQFIKEEDDLVEWYLDGEDNILCEGCFDKRI